METVTTAPPPKQIEALPQPLQHDINTILHGLSHSALYHLKEDYYNPDGATVPDYRSPLGDTEYESTHLAAIDTAHQQLDRAAGFVQQAYGQLESEQSTAKDSPSAVISRASTLSIEASQAAKEAGKSEEAVGALETFLVLDSFAHTDFVEDTGGPGLVTDIIKAGLASELVEAAHNTHGLVHVERYDDDPFVTSGTYSVQRVSDILKGRRPILQLASDKFVSDDFSRVAPLVQPGLPKEDVEYRRDLLEELSSRETIMLAKLTAEKKHNPDAGAALANEALRKLSREYQGSLRGEGGPAVARMIVEADEICKAADAASSGSTHQQEFQKMLGKVRHRRDVGEHHRINDTMTYLLDEGLFALIDADRWDLATGLISSSQKEAEVSGNSYHINNLDRFSDVEKSQVSQRIIEISRQKHDALAADLHKLGLSDTAITQVMISNDPDVARDVKPELLLRMDGPYGIDTAVLQDRRLLDVLYDPRTNVDTELLSDHILRNRMFLRLRAISNTGGSVEDGIAYVNSIARFNEELKPQLEAAELGGDKEQIRQHLLATLGEDFTDPLRVWNMVQRVYGDKAFAKVGEVPKLFSGEIDPDERTGERLATLQQSLQGVCDVDDILMQATDYNLSKLESLDAASIISAVQKLAGESYEEVRIKQVFFDLMKVPDQAEIVVATINEATPSFLQLLQRTAGRFNTTATLFHAVMSSPNAQAESGILSPDERQAAMERIVALFDSDLAIILNNNSITEKIKDEFINKLVPDANALTLAKNIKTAYEIFGNFVNYEDVGVISKIVDSQTVPDELRALGINKTGKAGLEQLKAYLDKFSESIYKTGEVPIGILIRHPFLRDYFKRIVRYEDSDWGKHTDDHLLTLLTDSQRARAVVGEEYKIGEYRIEVVDQEARDSFAISEDGLSEFRSYVDTIRQAEMIVGRDGQIDWTMLNALLAGIQSAVDNRGEQMSGGIEKLQGRIADLQVKEQDTTNLQEQLDKQQAAKERLASIRYDALDDFDISKLCQQIVELSSHKSIANSGLIQTLLVTTALMKLQQDDLPLPNFWWDANVMPPKIEDINYMADFIGHVTNQETWRDLFRAVGGQKQLDALLSIDALNENIARANNIGTNGTQVFRFVPTRGPLMELSGHIGDACWASKYNSMADALPNFTSVIMVQNADNANHRLAGSAMLIETTSAQGEPLLVIRGLNPIQNTINQLSQDSFYTQFTAYAKSIAEAQGRRLAIVIDNHSGGAGTNRPNLFGYLENLRPTLARVELASDLDTTFNGYNVVNDTYLVA